MTPTPKLTGGIILAAICSLALAADPVLRSIKFSDDFESGNLSMWEFPYAEDWAIGSEPGNRFLHMLRPREPGVPRRPLQFARLEPAMVGSFELQARVRRAGKSVIVVFNYADTMHFYYAHLSRDRGSEVPVHNGLFIVNGEPRRRLTGATAPPALPDSQWHIVRILRNAPSGSIEVFMDGGNEPLFSIVDRTFTCGQIGFGSFDETGDFDDIRLASGDAGCKPGSVLRPANAQ